MIHIFSHEKNIKEYLKTKKSTSFRITPDGLELKDYLPSGVWPMKVFGCSRNNLWPSNFYEWNRDSNKIQVSNPIGSRKPLFILASG